MTAGRVALLLLLLACGSVAGAQPTTGSIAGSVSTASGTGLAGATISLSNRELGIERTVITRTDGEYVVTGLPPEGTYEVHASLDGFAPVSRPNVVLTPGGRTVVSFLLVPVASEVMSVVGRLPTLQPPVATVQETISDRLAHSIPLIGRDFIALSTLTPGFSGNPVAPSPNGQIYWSHNVLVDGASHFSKWRSAPRTFYSGYPLDAIQEVQVLNSQFAPEYGDALASVTSAVTKSGSNRRLGSVLFFGQAGPLNDQPVFAARKPPGSQARFGATVGGPVEQDETFYFASYEGRRARFSNIVVSPAAVEQAVANHEDEHLAFVKMDHRLSSNDLVTARYNGQWFTWVNENGGLTLPGSGTRYRNDVHTALVSATQLVSTHILNQARFQFARYSDRRTDLQPSLFVSRAGYSMEGGTLGPFGFGATPEDTYEAADTLAHSADGHAIKLGTGFRYVRAHNESLPLGFGAYYFGGPPSVFPAPFAFVQGLVVSDLGTSADPRSVSSFAFVQDEWRLSPRLTLNVGLRYDIEQIKNIVGYSAEADRNNVQPRASAIWAPFGGRLAIRGGAGIYTQQHLLHYVNRAQLEGPSGSAVVTLTPDSPLMPAWPDILGPDVLSLVPRDVYVVDAAFRNPYSVQAAAGVQYPLFGLDVSADFVYLAGRDLMSIVDTNAPLSVAKPAARTVSEADALRPVTPAAGGYRKVIALGNEGRSWYRALQIKADRPFGRLQLVSSYTLARARDMANYQLPEDSRNLEAEIARADNDIRHTVTAGATWLLPLQGAVLRGWTLSAAGQFRSNRPYTITWGDDRNGTTQNDARPGGRNTGRTGPYRTIDAALARRFPIGSRSLEFRAEAFNILSTKNYDEYAGALSSPFFGQPVSAFPKRRLQFAAVVRF